MLSKVFCAVLLFQLSFSAFAISGKWIVSLQGEYNHAYFWLDFKTPQTGKYCDVSGTEYDEPATVFDFKYKIVGNEMIIQLLGSNVAPDSRMITLTALTGRLEEFMEDKKYNILVNSRKGIMYKSDECSGFNLKQ